ncbi:hypothetical protein ACHAW5_000237 [Stephanodiscus triporus]|uniref:von Hippel-Lindau disease tumour suppressor beta domain-containing protein n=1 Tax=Stephanodiscus triporus TaxID=2934178 RepID=A0ABD3NKD1_9STRA
MYLHAPIAVEGDAARALFGDDVRLPGGGTIDDVARCPAVCLVRGVDSNLAAFPLPEQYYDPEGNEEHESFRAFLSSHSCGAVEFAFVNYSPKTLSVYWIDDDGEKKYVGHLDRNEKNTWFAGTFIGHRFTFVDPDTEEVLLDHTVEFSGTIGVFNHENYLDPTVDIREEMRRELDINWSDHLRVKRTFTPLGFNKGRLPDDVFASMRAFYYNNRDPPHRLQEEWDSQGVFVNHWETDINFIVIPWHLKHIWQARLKDVVQEWAGCEIEQTDLYGIRQYESGARLSTHVDRINTHAVSLIVNIAQGNLTQPWTVEVYDHANRLHEVVMEPGDIVYYESAKALHGRNTPLAGGYYANLFTHYRPIGDPDWYSKDNPEGTPEPLMDVGKCELVGKPNEYSVGAVKCENPAIGPHLSPKMFTATSGEDLYRLWLSVGPSYDDEANGSDEL